ncbi:MAG: hypothetical protein LBV26_00845 [Bacteroidales bacterium]|jgi:hypothetical protein|nr:hypothetical protein [Bacteroidales bacterium]
MLTEDDMEHEYGEKWIWTAFSPETGLILCHPLGDRTLESCRTFFGKLRQRIANDHKPLYTGDELVHYRTVLKATYSTKEAVPRTGSPYCPGTGLCRSSQIRGKWISNKGGAENHIWPTGVDIVRTGAICEQ